MFLLVKINLDKLGDFNMKRTKTALFTFVAAIVLIFFTACIGGQVTEVEKRALYTLDRVYLDEQEVNISETSYAGSTLTFIGPENGGNIIIKVGDIIIQASINPSRDHPSFESGYWHHHLYSGVTTAGSPRINFRELLPHLGIDDNGTDDNTQSTYQRGNLHYVVETGEYRLRFIIDGSVHDLMFTQV